VFDFVEHVKIRSGTPFKADEALRQTTTFEEHVQKLPERLQRIIGRVSYSEDDLEEMAEKIQKGQIIFVSDGSTSRQRSFFDHFVSVFTWLIVAMIFSHAVLVGIG